MSGMECLGMKYPPLVFSLPFHYCFWIWFALLETAEKIFPPSSLHIYALTLRI